MYDIKPSKCFTVKWRSKRIIGLMLNDSDREGGIMDFVAGMPTSSNNILKTSFPFYSIKIFRQLNFKF